jgi:NAD(P)-dependent dehydrogenase (short-subunit alcohol dehydrogenase family)
MFETRGAADGVRVNSICPSFVATKPQQSWLEQPESRTMMSLSAVAETGTA